MGFWSVSRVDRARERTACVSNSSASANSSLSAAQFSGENVVTSCAEAMHRASDQFLSGTTLPLDQYRKRRHRRTGDRLAQSEHGRAVSENVR